jgi:hypothetical protein
MRTIVTAARRLEQTNIVTLAKVLRNVDGQMWHTVEVNRTFEHLDSAMRPKEWLKNMIVMGQVDKVIQMGYDGLKTELALEAESSGVDVILFREF